MTDFADDLFKCIFLNGNVLILIKIALKFIPKDPLNNIPASVQIMVWCQLGDKPLSEPMMIILLTHMRHSASLSQIKRCPVYWSGLQWLNEMYHLIRLSPLHKICLVTLRPKSYDLLDYFFVGLEVLCQSWSSFSYPNRHDTVRCRYNAVNFIQNPRNRCPIAFPWGHGMGCLLRF